MTNTNDRSTGVIKDLGDSISYSRNSFSTTLPKAFRYTAGHFWLSQRAEPGLWCVGLTTLASRLLGDYVEMQFDIPPGTTAKAGEVIGWYEGLKARTDLYCVFDGIFQGGNPDRSQHGDRAGAEPYDRDWLYELRGVLDENSMDVNGYINILNITLDKMQQNNPNGCACVCALCECHDDEPQQGNDCHCDCDCGHDS